MSLKICMYEDEAFRQFYPIALTRAIPTLRAGILPLYKRLERFFDNPDLCLCTRDQVAPVTAAKLRDYPVNIIKREADADVLFLNSRIRDYGNLPEAVKDAAVSTEFRNNGDTVAVYFQSETLSEVSTVATPNEYLQAFSLRRDEIPQRATTATLYGHCWDLMADIEDEIRADIEFLRPELTPLAPVSLPVGFRVVNPEQVFLGDGVDVLPGSVIDASHGPVYIGANTRIEAHVAIYGPCYIGPNSVIVAGKIAGSSIGHTSRVGGEVEESIFQSYVNKYHAGFIGHSYVGSWVNFGAMTTNSDLKNNYSNIRVVLNGENIDTGSIKVGSFIGDHTKFGIGTLLNTGISIGVSCNIYGGNLVLDKEVGSYRWGNSDGYDTYDFARAIETARRSMDRRHVTLTSQEEVLLRLIFDDKLSGGGAIAFPDLTGDRG